MKKLLGYIFSIGVGGFLALMVIGSVPCTSLYFLTSSGQRLPFPNDQEALKQLMLSGADAVQTCRAFGVDFELTAGQFSVINIAILAAGVLLGFIVGRIASKPNDDESSNKRDRADW